MHSLANTLRNRVSELSGKIVKHLIDNNDNKTKIIANTVILLFSYTDSAEGFVVLNLFNFHMYTPRK